jgi:glycosyltransferase involved in cell wall biosynthesis
VRIAYLHQYFNTPAMSGSTRSYEFGRRLVAAGHQVDMVTTSREPGGSGGWRTTDEAGMRVHWLPVPYSNRLSHGARMAAFARFAAAAAARAASVESDVVFATSTPLTIALPGAWAAWRRRVPMVLEVRDLWPEVPIAMGALKYPFSRIVATWLEHFAYRNADRIVALSPGMAEGVARTGYARERIAVIPNAADLEPFRRDRMQGRAWRQRRGLAEDTVLVAYLGTLGPANDAGYLVEVAGRLLDSPRLAFLIAGDGREREKIAALARDRGVLGHNLTMLPPMPKTEIADALSAVDVATSLFVPVAALEANSANKFFDGLAAGCCLAVNYGGWQAELLRECDAGLQLPRDYQGAADQLRALSGTPERIAAMGANARRLAEERFSRDALAVQLEAVLAAAAGAGRER